jgi:hypothetical protein
MQRFGMRIIGTIATPPERAEVQEQEHECVPRWRFALGVGDGVTQIPCMTGVLYAGTPPKVESYVAVHGYYIQSQFFNVEQISAPS